MPAQPGAPAAVAAAPAPYGRDDVIEGESILPVGSTSATVISRLQALTSSPGVQAGAGSSLAVGGAVLLPAAAAASSGNAAADFRFDALGQAGLWPTATGHVAASAAGVPAAILAANATMGGLGALLGLGRGEGPAHGGTRPARSWLLPQEEPG
jgi:hypothetical protein